MSNKIYKSNDGISYFVPYQKKSLESLNNIGIIVLAYLYRYRSVWGNTIWFSINHLINWCGYASGNKTRNMTIFKSILQSYIKLGWIDIIGDDIDISKYDSMDDIPDSVILKNIKINDPLQIIVNVDDIPIFDMDSNTKGGFVKLTFEEMDKIRLADTKFNIGDLVCAYLSIKQFIAEDSSDDTAATIPNDYRCKVAHPTIDYLMNLTDIKSTDTMSKYMDELVRLGLLYDKKCGSIRQMKNGGFIKFDTPTCYTLQECYLEQAEEVLKQYYNVDIIYPYNQQKDKPPVNYNPVRPKKDKSFHTDTVVTDTVSTKLAGTDEITINIEPKPSYSFGVQSNDDEDKYIADLNEYELIKRMGWDKPDDNFDNDKLPWELSSKGITKEDEDEFEELISSF